MKASLKQSSYRRWFISLIVATCAALPKPSAAQNPTPTPTPIPTVTETFGVADDSTPLHWVVYTPQGTGPWPVVLIIHGGGFRSGDEQGSSNMNAAAEDLRNAGYLALSIQYRLAPPGLISAQTSDGRYPDQINDCKVAVRAARADPRCNGLIGAVGGSAGGTQATYLAADGTTGDDKIEVAIGLSGAYDFSDQESLNSSGNFKELVENYTFAEAPPPEPDYSAMLLSASVVSKITSSVSPMLLVQSESESMPYPQMPALVAALDAVGATNYQTIVVPGTAHAWSNWAVVKEQALSFIATVFGASSIPTPTPTPTATPTPTPSETPPSIMTQPKNKTVNPGFTARFSVVATGSTPLSYQWRKNGANISGATEASYTTPATSSEDNAALFSVVVSNDAGSVTSVDATLSVRVPPTISKQPANRTVKVGNTTTFKVTASGTKPLTYQWRKNGADIAGATKATYTTPPVTSTDNGTLFSVVVSNAAGSVTSVEASLTVP